MKNMKTLGIISLLAIISSYGLAQPRSEGGDKEQQISTIFGHNHTENGGYGAFGAGYSLIDNRDGIVISGRAAWIVNHTLALGLTGSGFLNDFRYDAQYDEDVNLTGGYGGILIEPIIFPKAPVHLSFPIMGGVGGIAYTRTSNTWDNRDYRTSYVEDTEAFLIAEPGVEMELNVLRFFRLAIGMSYRFTSDIELIDTSPKALEGFTTGVTFKFGKF